MVSLRELTDKLSDLPDVSRSAIAIRAAMRVFPVLALRREGSRDPFAYWHMSQQDRHCLAILRCYQTSNFGTSLQKLEPASRAAAARAARSAYDATTVSASATDASYAAATDAARAATADAARAIGRAVTAAVAASELDAYTSALSDDLSRVHNGATELLSLPLWPDGVPVRMTELWDRLRGDLVALNSGFDVWIGWYEDRLTGQPLHMEVERQWALVPDEILTKSPFEVNQHLKALRDAHLDDQPADLLKSDAGPGTHLNVASTSPLPEIPAEQRPGLQFALGATGQIDLVSSGVAAPDDLAEIRAMRGAIIEAVDDLAKLLEGSNAYATIIRVAMRYKTAILADPLSVDQLYSYGVRLENISARIEREIASGDYPDLAPQAGEALDSVIALHGPMLYATARGRKLIENARAYGEADLDMAAAKPILLEVVEAIAQAKDVVAEPAREAIIEAANDIGEGKHPQRSTQVGVNAVVNFCIAAAKGIQKGLHPGEVEKATEDGAKKLVTAVVVGAPAWALYTHASTIGAFLLANTTLLLSLVGTAGVAGLGRYR
jgi:hypothetical protein